MARSGLTPRGGCIRVLVASGSLSSRGLVRQALSGDPDLQVIGGAADAAITLRMISMLLPDAITLDIESPEMKGLDTLNEIRRRFPKLAVIVCSEGTERGGLAAPGADAFAAWPSARGAFSEVVAALRRDLAPKIKQLFLVSSPAPAPENPRVKAAEPAGTGNLRCAVGIGVSTGGPAALETVIPMFPADFSQPVFIVQHMPKRFTRLLAERLQALTALRVVEAKDGDPVNSGTIYIAPGDYHMCVAGPAPRPWIRLNQEAPENGCRPAVDVLFRSMAQVYGGRVVAAILTGMGQDGARGAACLREKGAYIIAQNEASSAVWGMPGSVAQAGLANAVLPLNGLVPEILREVSRSR